MASHGNLGGKITLAVVGALSLAALALGGIAAANQSNGSAVTVVKETRGVGGREILSTNVVCGEGLRAVGGGHAFRGAHDLSKPVAFPVSAPGSTSDTPGAVQNAWDFVVVNPTSEKISVELYATCVPIG
ncbi:hypothetical protein [Microbispora catharanthi]|uniref:Uncharacterized protein n=1 Tax=Microbispora catharanthi TaxID=1712871 RepID=A0A5N6B6X0_9ACTN|nr:hypothetical protein [Microbispora catharanthi]KAB8176787.1 hypothetical protein FH610_038165 [Microbispora catharanthi]